MAYFGYSPAAVSGPPVSLPGPHPSFNNNQLLGSPNSSSGGGGGGTMSGSASPTGITTTSPPATSNTSCCEGGRPLVTDPVTGQSVCSCQYDPSRLTLTASYPRLTPYAPSPYAPPTDQNPYPTLESSAFYSPLGGAYGLKEGTGPGDMSNWGSASALSNGFYPYDPTGYMQYGYGPGYDLAARRKNATRESTATLKAWLNEHKKNPYPTKGEKIMLAIITKMTLTQVSTWFANARRRLKKENKMTWEPKGGRESDGEDQDDDNDNDTSSGPHGSSSPASNNNNVGIKVDPSSDLKSDCAASSKPKIWSLADTAACKTPPPPSHVLGHHMNNHHSMNNSHPHHHPPPTHHPMSHHPSGPPPGPPPPVSSSWSFALPAYRYGGFLPVGANEGVGTDTPPQTPPNLKVPLLPGSLSHFAPGAANHPSGLSSSSDLATTAFKPVLKSSSGGFCM